jgi:hypothetical protein
MYLFKDYFNILTKKHSKNKINNEFVSIKITSQLICERELHIYRHIATDIQSSNNKNIDEQFYVTLCLQ